MDRKEKMNSAVQPGACSCLELAIKSDRFELLFAPKDQARGVAALALGQLGEKAATREVMLRLLQLFRDSAYDVRKSAASALGRLGTKAATPEVAGLLVAVLDDSYYYTRSGAASALESCLIQAA